MHLKPPQNPPKQSDFLVVFGFLRVLSYLTDRAHTVRPVAVLSAESERVKTRSDAENESSE